MMGYKARRFRPIGELTLEELVPADHPDYEGMPDVVQLGSEVYGRNLPPLRCRHDPALRGFELLYTLVMPRSRV